MTPDVRELLMSLPFRAWENELPFSSPVCYPAYTAMAAKLQPGNILELGTYEGYGLIAFWLGAGPGVKRLDWVDTEVYMKDSNAHCLANLQAAGQALGWPLPELCGVRDRNALHWTGRYDLIHVDGDHSYDGALSDMLWAWERRPKTMLVDDYDYKPEVKRAVTAFSDLSGLAFAYCASLRGWAMFRGEQ